MLYLLLDSDLYLDFHKWYLFYYALYTHFEVQTSHQVMVQSYDWISYGWLHPWPMVDGLLPCHVSGRWIDFFWSLSYWQEIYVWCQVPTSIACGGPYLLSRSGPFNSSLLGLWFWCPYAIAFKTCSLVWLWSCFSFLAYAVFLLVLCFSLPFHRKQFCIFQCGRVFHASLSDMLIVVV